MPLHEDTLEFLEKRNAFRDELAAALRGETTEEEEQEDEAAKEENCPEDEPAAGAACRVPARDGTPCNQPELQCDILRRLDKIRPLECLRDEDGWPDSDGLYERLKEATLNEDDPDNSAFAQIQLMRQANVLESYRKMLLHKKQRLCHYLAGWCECMKKEPQSQEELEKLMLYEPIGRTVAETEG